MRVDGFAVVITCEYCDDSTLVSVRRTCKEWNRLSKDSSRVVRLRDRQGLRDTRVAFLDLRVGDIRSLLKSTRLACPQRVTISNEFRSAYDSDGWSDVPTYEVMQIVPFVRSRVIAANPRLRCLYLKGFGPSVDHVLEALATRCCTAADGEETILEPTDYISVVFEGSIVTSLCTLCSIVPSRGLRIDGIIELETALRQPDHSTINPEPCLQSLWLGEISAPTLETSQLNALSSLSTLSVNRLRANQPSSLDTFAFKSLTSLSFRSVVGTRGGSLELSLHNFPSLRSLDIHDCFCLTGLIDSARSHTALEYAFIGLTEMHVYGRVSIPNAKVLLENCCCKTPTVFACAAFRAQGMKGMPIVGHVDKL